MIRRTGRRTSFDLIFSTSRAGAEGFTWPEPFAVISITDPGSAPVRVNQRNIVARLQLQFWDLAAAPEDGRPVFDSGMAQEVLEFVESGCSGAKMLVIHCEAGISRSTGAANALGHIFGVEVRHVNREFADPNPLVMQLLIDATNARKERKALRQMGR